MKRLAITVSIIIALCAATIPSAHAAFPGTEVYLPSVGGGPGDAGSQWYTTIWVHNPTETPALVQFSFLHRNQSNPAPSDVFNDTILPGDTRRYDNAVSMMFGLDNAFGAIRAVSDQRLLVNSRIFSLPSGGESRDSVGQFFAAVPVEFGITAGQTTELLGVFQTQPADDSQFRYNYGFVEAAGGNVTVRVTAYSAAGVSLENRSYNLGPFEARQFAFKNQFGSISNTNIRLSVEVVSGSGRAVVFGSSLANRTNDPSTFEMSYRTDLLAGSGQEGGTITGVTAGQGLTGGGTTGTVTLDIEGGAGINVGTNSVAIADGGVSTSKLAHGAITTIKLADSAITTTKIADGAVTGNTVASDAITRAKIANDAINSTKLNSNAVTSEHIVDGQVQVADLGFGAVTSAKIEDGAVLTEDIAAGAVTSETIRNQDITTNDLANGAVNGSKVAVPLAISGSTTNVLEVSNRSSSGVGGSALRAINSGLGSGVAGYLESSGTDATVVVRNEGSGVLLKGYSNNGGNEELRIDNNGTIRLFNASYTNNIILNASTGRGTFREIRVTGHAEASLPIAYAFIDGNTGEKQSGTSNVVSKWVGSGSRYEIMFSGEDYDYDDYQTIVTPSGSAPAIAITNSYDDNLTVTIYNLSGTKIKRDFQFVTFKEP